MTISFEIPWTSNSNSAAMGVGPAVRRGERELMEQYREARVTASSRSA